MSSPTQIVDDVKAFVRSSVTTAVALAIGVSGIIATLLKLGVVPAQYETKLVTVMAVAAGVITAGRQILAWIDPKNSSFGRVAVVVPSQTGLDTQNPGATDPHDDSGVIAEPNEPDVPLVSDPEPWHGGSK